MLSTCNSESYLRNGGQAQSHFLQNYLSWKIGRDKRFFILSFPTSFICLRISILIISSLYKVVLRIKLDNAQNCCLQHALYKLKIIYRLPIITVIFLSFFLSLIVKSIVTMLYLCCFPRTFYIYNICMRHFTL